MKVCTFSLFCKHPERYEEAYRNIENSLMNAGFPKDDENPDLIIVLGGDGSLLRAFHEFGFQGKFIMVNTGHLGFFSDYSIQSYEKMIEDIIQKEYEIEEMPLMELKKGSKTSLFVSDLALQSERTCLLSLEVNQEKLTEIRCNGIVVGTQSGSTGYLISLGGSVMLNSKDKYQYHMIAPVYNKLFPNPINSAMLSKNDRLTIHVKSGEGLILLDGIPNGTINEESIELTLTDQMVKMIHFQSISHVKRIRHSIQGEEE